MTLQKSSSAKPKADPKQIEALKKSIQESVKVQSALLTSWTLLEALAHASSQMAQTLRGGGKILFFGNGGSASESLHMAGELVGRFGSRPRKGLPALALPANVAAVTAIGNDFGYEQLFSRQIEAFGQPGDVAVGLSTSGESRNVLKGLKQAKKQGLFTIGMTGEKGEEMRRMTDLCLCIPSSNTQRIQEAHLLMGHLLCELIEEALLKP